MKCKSDRRWASVSSLDVAQAPLLTPLEAAMAPAKQPRFYGALRYARAKFSFDESPDDNRGCKSQRQKIWVR